MPKFLVLAISIFMLSSCASLDGVTIIANQPKSSNQQYLSDNEDIPIMNEMEKIIEDGAIGFDSKNGSIVSSTYKTDLNLDKITEFYQKSLPQLGWELVNKSIKDLEFSREKRHLNIEFQTTSSKNIVTFLVTNQI